MAYTMQSGRQLPTGDLLTNLFSNEIVHGSHREQDSRQPWVPERTRSYPETPVKYPTIADQQPVISATSPTSPAALRPRNQTSPHSVKALTCYFWATHGRCKWSDEKCLYAHHNTGKIAQGPVQVEEGKPAVAGRNAANLRPVYTNWHKEHTAATGSEICPEFQQQLDHIKAKAKESNLLAEVQELVPKSKIICPPNGGWAPQYVNSYIVNRGMSDTSPTSTHQIAQISPTAAYVNSRTIEAPHRHSHHSHIISDPSAHYVRAPSHRMTQQPIPGCHQANCPQPVAHLTLGTPGFEQMVMMRTKDLAIHELAEAFDLAIETMEESQKTNHEGIQTLINITKANIERADKPQGRGDEHNYCGGGKLFNSIESCQGNAYAATLAQKRKITETSSLSYDRVHDLPCKLTGVAEKLSHTFETEMRVIKSLKAAKQKVATSFENIGDEDVLPKGWVQHHSSN